MTTAADSKFVLFAESQGSFLSPRELQFCLAVLRNVGSVKAAEIAGYPNPVDQGDQLYAEFRELLEAWREQNKVDYSTVLDVYRQAAAAEMVVKVKDDDGNSATLTQPAHDIRMRGAKGLCDVFGFNAATKTEVKHTADLTKELREMIDGVYGQAEKS